VFIIIVGLKNSGKTTLGTALSKIFVKRGYSVGAVKGMPHHDFTHELENSDTHRYSEAGADLVLAHSNNGLLNTKTKEEIDNLVDVFQECDVVICEGLNLPGATASLVCLERGEDISKVWKVRGDFIEPLAFSGKVAKTMKVLLGKPVYDPLDDMEMDALADLLIQFRH